MEAFEALRRQARALHEDGPAHGSKVWDPYPVSFLITVRLAS